MRQITKYPLLARSEGEGGESLGWFWRTNALATYLQMMAVGRMATAEFLDRDQGLIKGRFLPFSFRFR